MKRFHTPDMIAPVLDEIRTRYTPEYSPVTLAALDCVALLHRKHTNEYKAIRTPERGGFYYYGPAMKALFSNLSAWTEAAETEPGELDVWRYQEEQRIMEAVRMALIDEYSRPA